MIAKEIPDDHSFIPVQNAPLNQIHYNHYMTHFISKNVDDFDASANGSVAWTWC